MEYLIAFKEEITFATLTIAVIVAFVKGFLISQFKKFWEHIKRKQKVYYITCGVMGTLVFLFLSITVFLKVEKNSKQVSSLQQSLTSLKNGKSDNDYEFFLDNIIKISRERMEWYRTYLNLSDPEMYKKFWTNNHISIIFGRVMLRENQVPVFKYYNVVGKNPNKDNIEDFDFFINGNEKLFTNLLPIELEDVEAIKRTLLKQAKDKDKKVCFNAPVFWAKEKNENEGKSGCYRIKTLNKTTTQKTINEITQVMYAITTYADVDNSVGFFWFSISSKEKFFDTEMMHRFGQDVQDFIRLSEMYVNSKIMFKK
jgi:hypothetical protein